VNTVPSGKIRNVALIGHGGAGKTTLAEALLVAGGVLSRPGRIEDGTTVCDFEPEEVKRQISVSLALAPFLFEDCKINVIRHTGVRGLHRPRSRPDCRSPTSPVLVVSAVEGVESDEGDLAARRGARDPEARVREQARPRAGRLRTHAGPAPRPLRLGHRPPRAPDRPRAEFDGIADLLTDTAITYSGGQIVDRKRSRRHVRARASCARGLDRRHRRGRRRT